MLQAVMPEGLSGMYARIARDFPPSEYPPKEYMREYLREGRMEGLESPEGYAFLCPAGERRGLLYLFAVEPEARGQGTGSRLFGEICGYQGELEGMYIETESPEAAKSAEEKETRQRRIRFYDRLGCRRIPGLAYSLFGVEMDIRYRPLSREEPPTPREAAEDFRKLYADLFPPALLAIGFSLKVLP